MDKLVICARSVLLLFISGCEFLISDSNRDALPVIVQHPESLIVDLGGTAEFSVSVQGSDVYEFQWQKEGINISEANAARFTLENVRANDSARYRVTVSNDIGEVLSASASLLINGIASRIVSHPGNLYANNGNNVSFQVEVLSASPVDYQWQKNQIDLLNEDSSQLLLSNINYSDEGVFRVKVDNGFGIEGLFSNEAFLSIRPRIIKQPINMAGEYGDSITLFGVADGGGTLTYQWYEDYLTNPILMQNRPSYTIESLRDSKTYWLKVTNQNGSTISNPVLVNVITKPSMLVEEYVPVSNIGSIQLKDNLGGPLENMSGVTWDPDLRQYLVIHNSQGRIYKYTSNFDWLEASGSINLDHLYEGHVDTEGITYLAVGTALVSDETNVIYKIEYDSDITEIDYALGETVAYQLPKNQVQDNSGLESIAFSTPDEFNAGRIYTGQEKFPMRVLQFDIPVDPDPITPIPPPRPTPITIGTGEFDLKEPFYADDQFNGLISDIAGMVFDEQTGHLLILSQESCKVLQVYPSTGAIVSELNLTVDLPFVCGNGSFKPEGITIGPNRELVIVSEPNWIQIYQRP